PSVGRRHLRRAGRSEAGSGPVVAQPAGRDLRLSPRPVEPRHLRRLRQLQHAAHLRHRTARQLLKLLPEAEAEPLAERLAPSPPSSTGRRGFFLARIAGSPTKRRSVCAIRPYRLNSGQSIPWSMPMTRLTALVSVL